MSTRPTLDHDPIPDRDEPDPPRISVIVAIYNAAATVRDCLESLLRLEYPQDRVELLCIDNGSTDDTPQILKAYEGRLKVLRAERRGPAAARNVGVRCATGDVIALADSDCVVDPQWLRHLVEPLRDARVGVAGGTILSRRPCNSIEAFGEQIHDHYRAVYEFKPPYAITMNWAATRDVVERVGPFNEDLLRGSDVDWSYRVVSAGYQIAYAPAAIVYHQNERTPWGLMREGYVHGFHAVRVSQLHAALLQRSRQEPAVVSTPTSASSYRLPPQPWSDAVWSRLFRIGKRVGRFHASLSIG